MSLQWLLSLKRSRAHPITPSAHPILSGCKSKILRCLYCLFKSVWVSIGSKITSLRWNLRCNYSAKSGCTSSAACQECKWRLFKSVLWSQGFQRLGLAISCGFFFCWVVSYILKHVPICCCLSLTGKAFWKSGAPLLKYSSEWSSLSVRPSVCLSVCPYI